MFFAKKDKKSQNIVQDQYMKEVKEALEQPSYDEADYSERPMNRESAPLFVRVEKYRDMILTLQDMKTFISGLKQLFVVMQELETVRSESVNLLRTTVQRLEKNITEIDRELIRPEGIDLDLHREEVEVSHIEDSLTTLQKQLASLRKELQEFR